MKPTLEGFRGVLTLKEVMKMKYEKPEAEVVAFDFPVFMASSGETAPRVCSGYTDSVGHVCGTYTQGSSCASWTTPSFGGGSCSNFNGHKCYGYTDSTHNYCQEYGTSCGKF